MTYEALSPVQIETKLRALVSELTRAQQALAEARDLETDAEIALMRARDAAALEAPRPSRGGVTVAEREEHIDRAVRDLWEALRRAETRRRKAEELLRVTRDQAVVVLGLNKSVDTAYRMAGVAG